MAKFIPTSTEIMNEIWHQMLCCVDQGIHLIIPKTKFRKINIMCGHWHQYRPGTFFSLSAQDKQGKPEECSATLGQAPAVAHSTSQVHLDGARFALHLIPFMFSGRCVWWICWPQQGVSLYLCVSGRHADDHQLRTVRILIHWWAAHVSSEKQWSECAAFVTTDDHHSKEAEMLVV